MCMTRLSDLNLDEAITIEPMRAFPPIKDLVTDVSHNYRAKKKVKPFAPRKPDNADGTWNMLALAVRPDLQGQRLGAALVRAAEKHLQDKGQRILIVDTSGTDAFALTRNFYVQNGYEEEVRIRDFWADGDDKVIFRKAL